MPSIAFIEVDKEDEKRISGHFPGSIVVNKPISESGVLEKCKDAEIISTFIYSKFDKENLKKLPNLKLIATRSVGYDHIDMEECAKRKITVCNVPDYGAHVIAEHVFALLLSTLRHIGEADDRVEEGKFDYHGLRGMALKSKTIGIIGTGKIGCRVAQIAHGFGMKIMASDPHPKDELMNLLGVQYGSLDDVISASDIITIHAPLLDATKHMIDAAQFKKMKDGVIFVNTARGALVNTKPLVEALKSGKIAYALLDVMENEKDYEDNKELIDHPNAITTPHIAFYADDSMRNMYIDCFDSIEQWQAGEEPEHIVKPPKIVCDLPEIKKLH